MAVQRERHQVRLAEASPGARGFTVGVGRAGVVSGPDVLERDRQEQVALLHALAPGVVEQPAGAREPSRASSELSGIQRGEREPERAADGALDLAARETLLVRPCPGAGAVVFATGEIGGRSEALQIFRVERGLADRQPTAGRNSLPTPGAHRPRALARVRPWPCFLRPHGGRRELRHRNLQSTIRVGSHQSHGPERATARRPTRACGSGAGPRPALLARAAGGPAGLAVRVNRCPSSCNSAQAASRSSSSNARTSSSGAGACSSLNVMQRAPQSGSA